MLLPKSIPTLYIIAKERTPPTWEKVFQENDEELKEVSDFLKKDKRGFLPKTEDVFLAFNAVLGQDPYYTYENDGSPTAIGRAFSTRRGYKVAPSLKNLYIELERSIPGFVIPNHGDLSNWEKQGILLLNTSLTVPPNCQEEHVKIKLWNKFMYSIFKAIYDANPNCIYILLGLKAKSWSPVLGDDTIKLYCSHPSPLSFRSGSNPCLGSDIFNMVNEELVKLHKTPIDWNLY
jgi:uracil-DNA glycosylase